MRHPPRPIVGTTVDWRTALDRAKDELTGSLRCGDATTVAIVIRFIDQMRDIAGRVLVRDYPAERFAFGRVATEFGCGRDSGWLAPSGIAGGAASSGSDAGG